MRSSTPTTSRLSAATPGRGKLTLFDADGPRQRGVLERVVLRVPDLDEARAGIESSTVVADDAPKVR